MWMVTAQSDNAPLPGTEDYRIDYPSPTATVLSDAVS